MKSIESLNYDFSLIYGEKNWTKWNNQFPILKNNEIVSWIQDKIQQYTQGGKNPVKFQLRNYVDALQKYCNHYDATPEELLKEELTDRNKRLQTYLTYLINGVDPKTNKPNNPVSIKNSYQAKIKSFFRSRGSIITYQLKTEKSGLNEDETNLNSKKINLIANALNSGEYRLILKLQALTGLRISDILEELTSGKYNIQEHQDENKEIRYYIKNFETQKEKVVIRYIFFPKELSDLFISVTNKSDLTEIDLTTLFISRTTKEKDKEKQKRIAKGSYLTRIKEVYKNLEFKGNLKTHTFRTWFRSQVKRSQVDNEFMEHLMGHEQSQLADAYNQDLKDIEWFLEQWLILEPFILINTKIVDKTNETIITLEQEILNLKKQQEIQLEKNLNLNEQLVIMVKDNAEIKKSVEEFKKYIKDQMKR